MSEAEVAMLDALFTQSPLGLRLLDADLRVVRVDALTKHGVAGEDLVGRPFPDSVRGHADPEELARIVRSVLDSGVPVLGHVVWGRLPADPGRKRAYEAFAFRLHDPRGQVLGVALMGFEVTDREKAGARVGVVGAVRERVGRTLDAMVTCRELADTLVPGFADIAVVEVVDSIVRGDAPPLAPLPAHVPLRRVAFRGSADGDLPQAYPLGGVRSVPAPTPYSQALSDLRPRVVTLHPGLPWLETDPTRAAIHASGAHSLLAAPLTLQGTVLGLVSLYRTGKSDPYDEADVEVVLAAADHTALCIENARRYTREHSVAAALQRGLLPSRPASHTALETAFMRATDDRGGGWYDTISLSSARTALVVGKVSGEGINATATMAQLRPVIRSLAASGLEPDELLARLNDTATLLAEERACLPLSDPLYREVLTAGCVYAVYDPLTETCTFATAGHPGPVIAYPDGTVVLPDIPTGPPLGGAEDIPFTTSAIKIPEGSVLAFSSPPIPVTGASDDYGPLQRALAQRERPIHDLCDEVRYTYQAGSDSVLLLARTRPFPADRFAIWPLDDDPTAPATARRLARAQLRAWNIDEDAAYNTGLIVSELVTNAVRYGSPPLEMRLINDRTLTCEVRDTSPATPHLRHARTIDEGGRGLFIIAQLAQVWGTRYTADGKIIWTEQTLR
ncbi:SpoIIE family protein phosphatase [Streptomyces lutosisoli]|uniref:SpoIIE family protein phosphatase n=1 Tax=Streptomyces lutosisoli TaxID=2665721 RepID=A0ABW2VIC9_9ACTN